MTDDDVVEAMARAMFMRGWVVPGGMASDDLFALRKRTDPKVWRMHIDNTRAAIRALHERGGLVVARMPDEVPAEVGDVIVECLRGRRGFASLIDSIDEDILSELKTTVGLRATRAAFAAVRAAAVAVAEPPADTLSKEDAR